MEETIGYEAFFSPEEWDAIQTGHWSGLEDEEWPEGPAPCVVHTVTVWYPPGEQAGNEHAYEIDCEICGHVGVANTLEQAKGIRRLHRECVLETICHSPAIPFLERDGINQDE